MIDVQKLFLLRLQNVERTPETVLLNSHFIEVIKDSKLEPDVQETAIKLVGSGIDQYPSVVGRRKANCTLAHYMRGYGTGNLPHWVNNARAAWFTLSENNGYYILRPSNVAQIAATVWEYSGDTGASSSLVYKAGNIKFDWKITLDFSGDNVAKIEFTGVGAEVADYANATHPVVVKNRTAVPGLTGVTLTINGDSDYRPLQFEFTGGQPVEATVDPSQTSGVGICKVTDREIKFTGKVYRDVTGTTSPSSALRAGTAAATSFSWGSGECILRSNYTQITKCVPTEENGIQTWDLEGICQRNHFEIRVKGGASSSSSSSRSSSSESSSSL